MCIFCQRGSLRPAVATSQLPVYRLQVSDVHCTGVTSQTFQLHFQLYDGRSLKAIRYMSSQWAKSYFAAIFYSAVDACSLLNDVVWVVGTLGSTGQSRCTISVNIVQKIVWSTVLVMACCSLWGLMLESHHGLLYLYMFYVVWYSLEQCVFNCVNTNAVVTALSARYDTIWYNMIRLSVRQLDQSSKCAYSPWLWLQLKYTVLAMLCTVHTITVLSRLTQLSISQCVVKWISASRLSSNKWQWWVLLIKASTWSHDQCWVVLSQCY